MTAAQKERQERHGKTAVGAFLMVALGGKPQGLPVALSGLSTRHSATATFDSVASQKSPTMSNHLIPLSAIVDFDDEPRVLDTALAECLGFGRATSVRVLIERNLLELQLYGILHRCDANSWKGNLGNFPYHTKNPGKRGRPGRAYYLNEGQALVICALSRTDRAAEIRKAIIDVFMAYRHGKLVDVKAHYRRPPESAKPAISAPATDFRLNRRWDGMCELYIVAPMERAIAITRAYAGA